MTTVRHLIFKAKSRLSEQETAALDAEILLSRAMRVSRAYLFAHPEEAVPDETATAFHALLERRAGGEPIAYITGEREFWSLPLEVPPGVLIPRPETELLVEVALRLIPEDAECRIADLGTGSGAIALALATERPRANIEGTDISPAALEVARKNARRLNLHNVRFLEGNWMEPLTGAFDFVISNPPYIAEGDPHLELGDVRFEPRSALVGGVDGLDAIRKITAMAATRIIDGGWLMFEHGHDQAEPCALELAKHGFERIETFRDLEGTGRVTSGCRPGNGDRPGQTGP